MPCYRANICIKFNFQENYHIFAAHVCRPCRTRHVGRARGLPVPAFLRGARHSFHARRSPQAHLRVVTRQGVSRQPTSELFLILQPLPFRMQWPYARETKSALNST